MIEVFMHDYVYDVFLLFVISVLKHDGKRQSCKLTVLLRNYLSNFRFFSLSKIKPPLKYIE